MMTNWWNVIVPWVGDSHVWTHVREWRSLHAPGDTVVRNNARLVWDVVSLGAGDLAGMEDKSMSVGSAVCGGDGGRATVTLVGMSSVGGIKWYHLGRLTGITIMYPTAEPHP